jgi:hypothetical protein
MAYVYEIRFDIRADQMSELQIGASLERVLGYLRSLLPNEPGHVTSRAMYALEHTEHVHLVFESTWEQWEDLDRHRASSLAEEKVLLEFGPHVTEGDLAVTTYAEVD